MISRTPTVAILLLASLAGCNSGTASSSKECDVGYKLNSSERCRDVDECALGKDDCGDEHVCENTQGSFECVCAEGIACTAALCAALACEPPAVCEELNPGVQCTCPEGYSFLGKVCVNIDECAVATDTCDSNSTCEDTEGGYTCECIFGYSWDGATCEPLGPTLVITLAAGQPAITNQYPVVFDMAFSEAVTGVEAQSVVRPAPHNNSISEVEYAVTHVADNTQYRFVITGGLDTCYTPTITQQSLAEVTSTAGYPLQGDIIEATACVDTLRPSATITKHAEQETPTEFLPLLYELRVASDVVYATLLPAIIHAGTATGVNWALTFDRNNGAWDYYLLEAVAVSVGGLVVPELNDTYLDEAGNFGIPYTGEPVFYVNGPLVDIARHPEQNEFTHTAPVRFDIVFSEAIDPGSFEPLDITNAGTAGGIVWSIANSGDDTSFGLEATSVGGDGTLIPVIGSDRVADLAGRPNLPSSVPAAVLWDSTRSEYTWEHRQILAAEKALTDIVVDSGDNSVVISASNAAMTGNPVVVKRDATFAEIWRATIVCASVHVRDIAVDAASNIYITGSIREPIFGVPNLGDEDMFVSKLDSSGQHLWTRVLDGQGVKQAGRDILIDPADQSVVVVGGYTQPMYDLGTISGAKGVLARFSNSGEPISELALDHGANTTLWRVALFPNGNLLIASSSRRRVEFRVSHNITQTAFLKELDTAGNEVSSVSLIRGVTTSHWLTMFFGPLVVTDTGDYFTYLFSHFTGIFTDANHTLSRYDRSGSEVWTAELDTPQRPDAGSFAAPMDFELSPDARTLYLGGTRSYDEIRYDGATILNMPDMQLAAVSAVDGSHLWGWRIHWPYRETAYALALDSQNRIYLVGTTQGENGSGSAAAFFVFTPDTP